MAFNTELDLPPIDSYSSRLWSHVACQRRCFHLDSHPRDTNEFSFLPKSRAGFARSASVANSSDDNAGAHA